MGTMQRLNRRRMHKSVEKVGERDVNFAECMSTRYRQSRGGAGNIVWIRNRHMSVGEGLIKERND